MGDRREFLKQAGIGALLGLAAPLFLSPTCTIRPFLEERTDDSHEREEVIEDSSSTKPILPIYLTHCHHWFHAALWDAMIRGYLTTEQLPLTLRHFDSHSDLDSTYMAPSNNYNQKRLCQNIELIQKYGLEEVFQLETSHISNILNVGRFHLLGGTEGFWNRFDWAIPEWHPLANDDLSRMLFNKKKNVDSLPSVICQTGRTLDFIEDQTECNNDLALQFLFSRSNQPVFRPGSNVATIDLDYFSLYNKPAEYDFASDLEVRSAYEMNRSYHQRGMSEGIIGKHIDFNLLHAYYHPMTSEEIESRNQIMQNFMTQNFAQTNAPSMMHICESPLYCPREHASMLMDSLIGAIVNMYSDQFKIQILDFRFDEYKADQRFHLFINQKTSINPDVLKKYGVERAV